MSKKENFCVPMYRVMDDAAPLVETVITDKHGNKHRGLFVLDSCSTHNFLSERFDDFVGEAWKEEGPIEVVSLGNKCMKQQRYVVGFALGDLDLKGLFIVMPDMNLDNVGELPIFGVLGMDFLMGYGLAIDYGQHRLVSSTFFDVAYDENNFDFLVPMELGLDYFGAPIVPIQGKGTELLALLDTGSANNMFSKAAFEKHIGTLTPVCKDNTITCVAGVVAAKITTADVVVLSLPENAEGKLKALPPRTIEVNVLDEEILKGKKSLSDGTVPVADAILGSSFIGSEGWILDFSAKAIYKRKCCA